MKILAIADTHGNKVSLKIARKYVDEVDRVIFLGDYVDSHQPENNWLKQKSVLNDILAFKKEHADKVTCLFGNHDICYLPKFGGDPNVSGHQYYVTVDIQEYFCEHYEDFQAIEVVDNWIFSHAGVTQNWLDAPLGKMHYERDVIEGKDVFWKLEDANKAFKTKQLKYFNHNSYDPYGDDESEGCMWIRPPSLIRFGVEGYNQCIGHTVLAEDAMDYWNLESRIVSAKDWYDKKRFYKYQYEAENEPSNLDCKYVFIDSPDNNVYAIIDTQTNEVLVKTFQD